MKGSIVSSMRYREIKLASRHGSIAVVLFLIFVSLFIVTSSAVAQTTVATIEGTIKDTQGSVVAGAEIVVRSPSLGIERNATSDENGFYRITALPAGLYSLSITHSGF